MPIKSSQVSVTTTPVKVVDFDSMRSKIIFHNHEHAPAFEIYLGGDSNVSASTGIHLTPEVELAFEVGSGDEVWAVSNRQQGASLHILRVTQD